MAKTVYDKLMQDKEFRKYYQREELMSEITLAIYQTMKSKGLTQKKLAEMAGVSKGRVSQILSGNHNITVATISDLLYAFDSKMTISVVPLDIKGFGDEVATSIKSQWVPSQEAPRLDIVGDVEKEEELQRAA